MPPSHGERLTSLTPQQWSLTLERTSIIKRYLRIDRPTAKDADAHARLLGIGRSNFYRLVRIFREERQTHSDDDSARKQSMISPETEAVICEVITELGPESEQAPIFREAVRRCEERGIVVPSLSATRTRIAAARRAAPVTKDLPPLVLDHCALRMNVKLPSGSTATAVISALIHTASGQVIGHRLAANPPSPTSAARALLDALSGPAPTRRGRSPAPSILVEIDDEPAWTTLIDALTACGFQPQARAMSERSPGQVLMRILGMRLGKTALAPRKTFHRGALPKAPIVLLQDAEDVIRQMIQQHNASVGAAKSTSLQTLIANTAVERLRAALLKMLDPGQL